MFKRIKNRYLRYTLISLYFVIIFFCAIELNFLWLFGYSPDMNDIKNPIMSTASEVYTADGKLIGRFYNEDRSPVEYKDISPSLIHALVATEDSRFYQHNGVDYYSFFTSIFSTFKGDKRGGSTITQQLAKNLFTEKWAVRNPFKRFMQKLKELIIAVRIERRYSKQEILTMYFNTVDFGAYSTFGIKSAARTYFNTTPDNLTPDQAAVLVGMLKGPDQFSPVRHPDKSLSRRNFILHRMEQEGYLTQGQEDEYKQKPLNLDFNPIDHNDGLATYFRAVLRKDVQKILADPSLTKTDGTAYDIDRDGLKIYTSINSTMQEYAEDAQQEYMRQLQNQFNQHWAGISRWKTIKNFKLLLDEGMRRSDRYHELKSEGKTDDEIIQDFNTPTAMNIFSWRGDIDTTMKPIDSIVYCKMLLRNSLMSMDPVTGFVKAWVGGINFKHFKYDQVKMGTRQVGSTAKPFTYSVAVENGFSPCMEVDNVPVTITGYGEPWTPKSTETIPGVLTLRQALAHSQNYITAYVMREVGPTEVVNLIKRMGVNSPDIGPYPSICLGTFGASVYDMTGAYCVFANHGIWTEPTYLLRIEDKNGNLLYEHKPKVVEAMNEQTAYVMTYMLKGVIEEGTGQRMHSKYGLTNPIAGKTGTTQDNSDGWFIGVTPQLVTGIWTGCEDRDIHFRSTALGEGANSALPIFALYMKKVYANADLGIKKNIDFDPPKTPLTITLDCNAYKQQQQPAATETDKKLGF